MIVCAQAVSSCARRRRAREYLPAARRVRHAADDERAGDRHRLQVRQRNQARDAGADVDHRLFDLPEFVFGRSVELRDERRRHTMRARRDA